MDYKKILGTIVFGGAMLTATEAHGQQRVYVTKFPDKTVHVGVQNNGRSYQRNVTHDYNSAVRVIQKEARKIQNTVQSRNYAPPARIKVKKY